MKRRIIFLLFFLISCTQVTQLELSTPTTLCNPPYYEWMSGQCCLDVNNNRICDSDERARFDEDRPQEISKEKPPAEPKPTLTVTRIIDGDTFVLSNGEKVRLIGIDTPERGQPYFEEATKALERLVMNKQVSLKKDVTERDRYGRLLYYVYVNDVFVNLELVKQGLAKSYAYPPDTENQNWFDVVQTQAQNQKLGIWKPVQENVETIPSTPTSSKVICSYNAYNCGDFNSYSQAKAVFDACGTDVHRLDGDNDGIPCESLR